MRRSVSDPTSSTAAPFDFPFHTANCMDPTPCPVSSLDCSRPTSHEPTFPPASPSGRVSPTPLPSSKDDGLEVYVAARAFTEWGGRIFARLPSDVRDTMIDLGVCHYMTVFRTPDGRYTQFDFGPRGGDIHKTSGLPRFRLPFGASTGLSAMPPSPPTTECQPSPPPSPAALTVREDGRDCRVNERFATVPGAGSITAANAAAAAAVGSGGDGAPGCGGGGEEEGDGGRAGPGVAGEIRERPLAELPSAHLYAGHTRMSLSDIRQYNQQHLLCYQLHRNDCRHYVNSVVKHATGLESATSRMVRHYHRQKSESAVSGRLRCLLVGAGQLITDVGNWDKVVNTTQAGVLAAVACQRRHALATLLALPPRLALAAPAAAMAAAAAATSRRVRALMPASNGGATGRMRLPLTWRPMVAGTALATTATGAAVTATGGAAVAAVTAAGMVVTPERDGSGAGASGTAPRRGIGAALFGALGTASWRTAVAIKAVAASAAGGLGTTTALAAAASRRAVGVLAGRRAGPVGAAAAAAAAPLPIIGPMPGTMPAVVVRGAGPGVVPGACAMPGEVLSGRRPHLRLLQWCGVALPPWRAVLARGALAHKNINVVSQ